MTKQFFLIIIFFAALISCQSEKKKSYPDVSHINVDVEIQRIDQFLENVNTVEQIDSLLNAEPIFAEAFLKASAYPDQATLSKRFYELMTDPNIDSLFIEVNKEFNDLSKVEEQFEEAFRRIKYYYPDFKVPKVKTVLTGILNDMYLSDSLIIIGLDYYLGPDAKYSPDIPEYIAKRYQKEYIVPQCVMLISSWYNANDQQDQKALADMIFYGKAYYFTDHMLPHINDTLITGYTASETADIYKNEEYIWKGLLQNEAIYETSHIIKEKFLGERPKTFEISQNCPGRIGRWVGYRIVDEYMQKHPDVSLQQLMADPQAQKIFNESNYRPID